MQTAGIEGQARSFVPIGLHASPLTHQSLERAKPVAAHDSCNLVFRILAVEQCLREVGQLADLREPVGITQSQEFIDCTEYIGPQRAPSLRGWKNLTGCLVSSDEIAAEADVF